MTKQQEKSIIVKLLSGAVLLLLVVSLTLAVMGRIGWTLFWIIAALSAIYTYFGLPRLK